MDIELVKEQAEIYNRKWEWTINELQEREKFRSGLKFEREEDLEFEVMDFYYDGILSQILKDARERSKREGLSIGYSWGKKYLNHYGGWRCILSKAEHPALHTRKAYDVLTERLAEECTRGDAE